MGGGGGGPSYIFVIGYDRQRDLSPFNLPFADLGHTKFIWFIV